MKDIYEEKDFVILEAIKRSTPDKKPNFILGWETILDITAST